MNMRKINMEELSPSVRSFLAQVRKGNGILVEDRQGRARVGIMPYEEATLKAQAAAVKRVARIQKKVAKTMKARGRTEADFDRLLQRRTRR